MKKVVFAALCVAVLSACGDRQSRYVGNVNDPICAPDGSVVFVQYATAKGDFPTVRASRENCGWNKQ